MTAPHRAAGPLGVLWMAALLLTFNAAPRAAQAALVVWQSPDGLRAVEFSPSLKLFFFGASGFLEAPGGFEELWPLPDVGGGLLGRLRFRFLADLSSRVRFVAHYEHRPRVLSHGRLLSAASASLQGDEAVPLRLTPLQWTIVSSSVKSDELDPLLGPLEPTFAWVHEIDRVFFSIALPRVDLTVGRQAVGWGLGRLWAPLDVFAPLTATDLDREERRGIDALRLTFPLSATSLMEVVAAAGSRVDEEGDQVVSWRESALAWLLRVNVWRLETMLLAGKIGSDRVVGAAVTGQIRGIALRGEMTSTTDAANDSHLRATVGAEFGTSFGLNGVIEYHYNGFGTLRPGSYLNVAQEQTARLSRGLVSGLGQHYAGVTLMWQPLSVLGLSFMYIQSCQDGSLILGPALEYSVADEVRLSLAAFVPLGRGPSWRTDGLLPQIVPRSEFGLSPQLYVLQLRVNL